FRSDNAVACDDGYAMIAPVGKYQPNHWGLCDMTGNVFEWCEEHYAPNYEGAPTDGSARLTGGWQTRVARGGGWSFQPIGGRSEARPSNSEDARNGETGFRVVRAADR